MPLPFPCPLSVSAKLFEERNYLPPGEDRFVQTEGVPQIKNPLLCRRWTPRSGSGIGNAALRAKYHVERGKVHVHFNADEGTAVLATVDLFIDPWLNSFAVLARRAIYANAYHVDLCS